MYKYYLIVLLCIISCKSKSQSDEIKNSVYETLKIINAGDFKKFRSMIAVRNIIAIGKDEEQIESEFGYLQESDSLKNVPVQSFIFSIPDTLNRLGQIVVSIPVDYKGSEFPNAKHMILRLYFGPPNLFPLTKLSGYTIDFLN